MNYRTCCICVVVASFPMASHADLLTEWFGEKAKEEVKNTLPNKTTKMVDSLEFAGEQTYKFHKDSIDHVSRNYMLDPIDDSSAAQLVSDDKRYYERLREQTKEIALEYSPKIVKDAVSFFDTVREGGTKLLGYVGRVGAGSDDFHSQFEAEEARVDALAAKEEAERAKRRREVDKLAKELGIPTRSSGNPTNRRSDADALARELGIAEPSSPRSQYTATQLENDLVVWEEREQLRKREEQRQRLILEERERVAAIERAKREEDRRRQQQIEAQEARDRQTEDDQRQATQRESQKDRGPGWLDVLVQGANTYIAIEGNRGRARSESTQSASSATSAPSQASGICPPDMPYGAWPACAPCAAVGVCVGGDGRTPGQRTVK